MYLDDLEKNKEINIPKVVIDKNRMIEFARLYDPIPLHCDEEYAKSTRFKKLIAPGVMSFMTVWAEFTKKSILGDELIAGKSTKIQWFKPVFAGDILEGKAVITDIIKRNDYNGIVILNIDVYNQNNELVMTNTTEAVVKCKQ